MLGSCIEGVMHHWYYSPFFDEFNPNAYKLTLNYLKKAPRSKDLPDWSIISNINKAPTDEWRDLAKKDFKAKDLVAALSAIAKDEAADSLAREYAIQAIGIHGTKADLKALDKAIKDDKLKSEIAKAMNSAK